MNIVFTPTAWEQYTDWQREDKKIVKRINELIKDIDRNGLLNGIGKDKPSSISKALCANRIQRIFAKFLQCIHAAEYGFL